MKNKPVLITYPDSLGNDLSDLNRIMDTYFSKAFGGIHILPFFPSSGDRGFSPEDYSRVDPAFGDWDSIHALGEKYDLIFDYMINHISRNSRFYRDFLERKDDSPYKNLFIRYKDFWRAGEPTAEQVDLIYKRKPCEPCVTAEFADGTAEKIWSTFSEEQIDLNTASPEGREFLADTLRGLASHGAAMVRLDAFAYAVKKENTNCFFVEPEIWELLNYCAGILRDKGAEILPEIHEHYTIQKKIADQGFYVYDFALPMLLLHALYFGQTQYLRHWLEICPREQFTTLDTHDGIGVVDVKDLLPDGEIEKTKEHLFRYGANVKKIYNTAAYNNLDIYQINCTYYSALGDDDDAYLLARAVQFFCPGIPQVYYVGALAGKNDLTLLEATKEGRNINRHYYSEAEIHGEMRRPVVRKLLALLEFRSSHRAFSGDFALEAPAGHQLRLTWTAGPDRASLLADFASRTFEITVSQGENNRILEL
ncbi:sucrose phosphorylase [Breznakiella homolactica]|nr:sucrose phosphorylase [Breznakiella homolactica]QQO11379.2 sucrose phosphorylase [Breznakiella homolactica]